MEILKKVQSTRMCGVYCVCLTISAASLYLHGVPRANADNLSQQGIMPLNLTPPTITSYNGKTDLTFVLHSSLNT